MKVSAGYELADLADWPARQRARVQGARVPGLPEQNRPIGQSTTGGWAKGLGSHTAGPEQK